MCTILYHVSMCMFYVLLYIETGNSLFCSAFCGEVAQENSAGHGRQWEQMLFMSHDGELKRKAIQDVCQHVLIHTAAV